MTRITRPTNICREEGTTNRGKYEGSTREVLYKRSTREVRGVSTYDRSTREVRTREQQGKYEGSAREEQEITREEGRVRAVAWRAGPGPEWRLLGLRLHRVLGGLSARLQAHATCAARSSRGRRSPHKPSQPLKKSAARRRMLPEAKAPPSPTMEIRIIT